MRPTPPLRPRTRAFPGGAAATHAPGSRSDLLRAVHPRVEDALGPEDQRRLVEEQDLVVRQEEHEDGVLYYLYTVVPMDPW